MVASMLWGNTSPKVKPKTVHPLARLASQKRKQQAFVKSQQARKSRPTPKKATKPVGRLTQKPLKKTTKPVGRLTQKPLKKTTKPVGRLTQKPLKKATKPTGRLTQKPLKKVVRENPLTTLSKTNKATQIAFTKAQKARQTYVPPVRKHPLARLSEMGKKAQDDFTKAQEARRDYVPPDRKHPLARLSEMGKKAQDDFTKAQEARRDYVPPDQHDATETIIQFEEQADPDTTTTVTGGGDTTTMTGGDTATTATTTGTTTTTGAGESDAVATTGPDDREQVDLDSLQAWYDREQRKQWFYHKLGRNQLVETLGRAAPLTGSLGTGIREREQTRLVEEQRMLQANLAADYEQRKIDTSAAHRFRREDRAEARRSAGSALAAATGLVDYQRQYLDFQRGLYGPQAMGATVAPTVLEDDPEYAATVDMMTNPGRFG